ncbi:hypothetical protein ACFO1B_30795 [Dactylosporangium siamense]|uniref:Uncharacterized protein n=1 Tax=Dactylosporangium siamense TaxID=685454 RepID=A0A919PQ79_9ACTN|nr:hypothetical protein [Dactylosporangium siamense]GIG48134.1 hypothetical protein Dsi01nite_061750 [Dactylosporangium siamense]
MQPEADESVPELATQPDDEPPAPAPPQSAPNEPAQVSPAPVNPAQSGSAQSGSAQSGSAQLNGGSYRAKTGGTSAAALASMWNESDRQRIRGRWLELQSKFLDDPHLVAGEAERLVQEAVTSLTASLDARRTQLHQQRAGRGLDTENLRASLRDYREFLDRILGL